MANIKPRSAAGIFITEKDVSEITQPAGTSTGAVVVRAKKGRINYPQIVTSDKDYIDKFGKPVFTSGTSISDTLTPEMGYGSYAALIYLQESDSLYVVRDYDTGDKYASVQFDANGSTSATSADGIQAISDPNGVPDDSDTIYTLNEAIGTGKSLLVGATGPGTDGNNLAITVETFHADCDWFGQYDDYTSATDTSAHPIESEIFKVSVFEKETSENWDNIAFSTISASPVETWYGTRTSQQDDNNQQLFIEDVVNGISNYIYVVAGDADFTGLNSTPTEKIPLSGGAISYGTNIGSTDGWSYFESKEETSPNILICTDYTMSVKQEVARIAQARQDCIAVGQSGQRTHTTVANVKSAETYGYTNPSYIALYAGWSKYYDSYNDKSVFIPNSIWGATLMARTDRVANVWEAPAGTQRGVISSVGQNVRFSRSQIGQLSDVNINSILNLRGIGDVMWDSRTAQQKQSALKDINVRRLMIFIESSLEQAYLPFLFSVNNTTTRQRVFNITDSFLGGLAGAGAFDDADGVGYQVVCDTSNNTSIVINNNKLAVDIYVKPIRIIRAIELTAVITRSGVSFSEVIGA